MFEPALFPSSKEGKTDSRFVYITSPPFRFGRRSSRRSQAVLTAGEPHEGFHTRIPVDLADRASRFPPSGNVRRRYQGNSDRSDRRCCAKRIRDRDKRGYGREPLDNDSSTG